MRFFGCLVLVMMLSAAGWLRPAAADPFTLNSGETVDIVSIRKETTPAGTALTLRYRGTAALGNREALRREVDALWEFFVVNAERSGQARAVIAALGPKTAKASNGAAATPAYFTFEKRQGRWRALESRKRAVARLDKSFITAFQRRIDWATKHADVRSLLMFMDEGWSMTVDDPQWQAAQPVTLGREMALEVGSEILASAAAHSFKRDILAVRIARNGYAARIDSRETDITKVAGHTVTTTSRSSDYFELRGNVVLWTRSVSRVEKMVIDLVPKSATQTSATHGAARQSGRAPVKELLGGI